jgi:hypothetical protein
MLLWFPVVVACFSRHLTPFSRHFTQIDPDAPQRQEAQIVQSQSVALARIAG